MFKFKFNFIQPKIGLGKRKRRNNFIDRVVN